MRQNLFLKRWTVKGLVAGITRHNLGLLLGLRWISQDAFSRRKEQSTGADTYYTTACGEGGDNKTLLTILKFGLNDAAEIPHENKKRIATTVPKLGRGKLSFV